MPSVAHAQPQPLQSNRIPRRLFLFVLAALLGLFYFGFCTSPAHAQKKIKAPSLEGGTDWINTDKEIKIESLRGRVVLLDFWTLCCINCIHTLPDLARLEAKYPGVLVVIGVHSPKFPNEKKTESIRKAVLRYQIKHPVVNDANMAIWRRYEVRAWPTLVLIDPDGNLYGYTSGEGRFSVLDEHIGKLVKSYKAKKKLKTDLLPFQLARKKEHPGSTPLYFPGKVLADKNSNRLFIADSTHHRIVITDLQGKKIAVAGTGEEGAKDGPFSEATFSDPQGMTLVGNTLYVSDRKNHMIRALDLEKKTVKVAAGTGKQDRFGRGNSGLALKTGLNSPWDLLHFKGDIFIAMAGHHQIWKYNLEKDVVSPYAGDGRENIYDATLANSSFAQPSGLDTDGKTLFVADSETSAIRAMPIDGTGKVTSIVGQGLFEFGDKDGKGDEVRLQHALGVQYRNGKLYITDTYNSKLKLIDPKDRTCKTIEIKVSEKDKEPVLNEPGGLSFAGDKLYIADTNSHRIRVFDTKTNEISTLQLQGVEPPEFYVRQLTKKN